MAFNLSHTLLILLALTSGKYKQDWYNLELFDSHYLDLDIRW